MLYVIVIILAIVGFVTIADSIIKAYRAKRDMKKMNEAANRQCYQWQQPNNGYVAPHE